MWYFQSIRTRSMIARDKQFGSSRFSQSRPSQLCITLPVTMLTGSIVWLASSRTNAQHAQTFNNLSTKQYSIVYTHSRLCIITSRKSLTRIAAAVASCILQDRPSQIQNLWPTRLPRFTTPALAILPDRPRQIPFDCSTAPTLLS